MTTLPRDNDNNAIQALRLNPNGAHHLNVTTSSIRNSAAFDKDTHIVSVYATGPVYINFGENAVMVVPAVAYLKHLVVVPDGQWFCANR